MGPAAVGKSTIASSYCHAALVRGKRVLVLVFDETKRIFLARAAGVGMDIGPYAESGSVLLEQIDPAETVARRTVVTDTEGRRHFGAGIVVIDSLHGLVERDIGRAASHSADARGP